MSELVSCVRSRCHIEGDVEGAGLKTGGQVKRLLQEFREDAAAEHNHWQIDQKHRVAC